MKKAIIFDTKSGTTEKCAQLLQQRLKDIEVINIKNEKPDINDYDLLIFGSAYYAGSISNKLKKFIKANMQAIKDKKYAFYICCASEDDYKEVLVKNVGEEMVNGAVVVDCFGYEVNTANAKGLIKFVLKVMEKAMKKENKPLHNLKEQKIENFAKIISEAK